MTNLLYWRTWTWYGREWRKYIGTAGIAIKLGMLATIVSKSASATQWMFYWHNAVLLLVYSDINPSGAAFMLYITELRHRGTYPKYTSGFYWVYTHLKTPKTIPQKTTQNLIQSQFRLPSIGKMFHHGSVFESLNLWICKFLDIYSMCTVSSSAHSINSKLIWKPQNPSRWPC